VFSSENLAIDLIFEPEGQVDGKTHQKAQMQELSRFLSPGPPQCLASGLLFQTRMPKGQQGEQPKEVVDEGGKPRPFPGT
jgi:hypothetical protein